MVSEIVNSEVENRLKLSKSFFNTAVLESTLILAWKYSKYERNKLFNIFITFTVQN